jgi:GT2 family glycosyltransferase
MIGSDSIGVVIIGRNEGERLERCLESVRAHAHRSVYVDSGSTDDSVALGRRLGFDVVELDMLVPFTAARARNEGFRRLTQISPSLELVFFVDGDCEVSPTWIQRAASFLAERADVAAVCGRRRERFPERSIYNLLCDMEWAESRPGEIRACGGDVVMRASSFQAVGGYRADVICGEDPEICVRLRQAGFRIWCLDADMTLHDAAMYRFSQWWRRMLRGGYAYALGVALHGAPPERHWVRESRSAWIWGLFIPAGVLSIAVIFGPRALILFGIYPLQVVRLALRGRRSARENWWRAAALVGCKFPEMLGELRYQFDRVAKRRTQIIEYK